MEQKHKQQPTLKSPYLNGYSEGKVFTEECKELRNFIEQNYECKVSGLGTDYAGVQFYDELGSLVVTFPHAERLNELHQTKIEEDIVRIILHESMDCLVGTRLYGYN